ncbi:hypothetical protein AMK59_6432 [Oryctes borbonicus]|uniref:Uncharacterized protein n=1 Tax=Oryctes borbonicus TaxID=1629725 RepID=A0A0T6AZU5_9SCAR|nr:hypothetical protein AMK59_6432 [Oryctes borbonicus]
MFSWIQISTKAFPRSSRQVKNYGRWTHRRPVRILPSEEHSDSNTIETDANHNEVNVKTSKASSIQWRHAPIKETLNDKPKLKETLSKLNIKKESSYDMLQTVIDSNGEFIYTKLPNKDCRVISILTNIQSTDGKEKKSILLEGKRLIQEALENNCKLEYLLFSRKSDVEQMKSFLPKSGATLYKIPYREIQLWSALTTSPGIMERLLTSAYLADICNLFTS